MSDIPPDITVYDWQGNPVLAPPCPVAESGWEITSNEPSPSDSTIERVQRLLSRRPIRSRLLIAGAKSIEEVELEDGSKLISRRILTDDIRERWVEMLRSETRLLRSLEESCTLPIPKILFPCNDEEVDFMFQTMLPGTTLLNAWSHLNMDAKNVAIKDFAQFSLRLYNLEVPQCIGTVVANGLLSKESRVEPVHHLHFRATRTFDDIVQYADFLIDTRMSSCYIGKQRSAPTEEQRKLAQLHLEELRGYIKDAIAEIKSDANAASLLRCVLVHGDLVNDLNMLVDKDGHITGIVDWEIHLLHPAVLAASYPPWLIYDGCSDPRFVDPDCDFWLESRENATHLREVYEQAVKEASPGYWNALVMGEKLRSCMSWLFSQSHDPGCAKLKQWMDATFA